MFKMYLTALLALVLASCGNTMQEENSSEVHDNAERAPIAPATVQNIDRTSRISAAEFNKLLKLKCNARIKTEADLNYPWDQYDREMILKERMLHPEFPFVAYADIDCDGNNETLAMIVGIESKNDDLLALLWGTGERRSYRFLVMQRALQYA